MDTDLALVLGIIIGGFSLSSLLSAITSGRAARATVLTVLISTGLIYYAVSSRAGGYPIDEIPDAFIRVFNGIFS